MKIHSILSILLLLSSFGVSAQSVLATGNWWKLKTIGDGIYHITVTDVPALQGVAIQGLAVYGRGAGMLSTRNSDCPIDDMPQLATDVVDRNGNGIFDNDDELLFFGQGSSRWVYNSASYRWEYEQHAYADTNCYYLTDGATSPLRISVAETVAGELTLNTYTAVAHVDNDLTNIFGTGQKWMGEKFSTAQTQRSFQIEIPASTTGRIPLRMGLANRDYSTGIFTISTDGYYHEEGISGTVVYNTVEGEVSSTSTVHNIDITFSPGTGNATGYLDFIELNSHTALHFNGGQLLVRNDLLQAPTSTFAMTGANATTRVWAVGVAGKEREMALTGGTWSDSTNHVQQYIVFDGTAYLSPSAISPLSNQNLHGSASADLVIVSHPALAGQGQRLATLHELVDGISTLAVTADEVYNEYSSGKQDPMAIRGLLRDLKNRHPYDPPRYLLLLGKGTYDNRDLQQNRLTTVVTYETPYSFDDDGASYCSDDMLGYLDGYEIGISSEKLDVSVGRLPARNADEANHMVDKIEGYMLRRDLGDKNQRGDWRNWVALLADDADPGSSYDSIFAHSSEVVASDIETNRPHLNIDKLYADSFQQSTGAIGSYYPDLNNALRQRMNNGCLLINYIGHGSSTYIGTERYMELSDLESYSNIDRLPLFVTSTCSYGRYDMASSPCGAEAAILAPAAAVAVISAARPIVHTERFNNDVVQYALNPSYTIGDALRIAKNRTPVAMCICLLGDPALRLSQPSNRVVVTHINQRPVEDGHSDTATVLSRVTVSGEIQDSLGNLINDFDGTIYPIVFDRKMKTSTLANDNPGTEVKFSQQKNVLYRGSHQVEGGRFEYSFIVPKDVAYQYAFAKLSHYAHSGSDHATGHYSQLLLGGLNDTADIGTSAPSIALYLGDTNFRSGGLTGNSPSLMALLSDSAGINAGSGLGHDITAILDGNPGSLVVLNDLFEPDVEHMGCGTVNYRYSNLEPGPHTLTLKAWNIYNISSEATIHFTVCNPDTLAISDLLCYPNPTSGETHFSIEINNNALVSSSELQLYNSRGQLVYSLTPSLQADSYVIGPVTLDLGNIPSGLYLARILITGTDGTIHQQTTKCIVR